MIPKSFNLLNRRWVVRITTWKKVQAHLKEHHPTSTSLDKPIHGLCDVDLAVIFLCKDMCLTQETLEHSYFHELVHAIKFANGEEDHDEVEVDYLGALLHQIELTKKGA